MKFTRLSVDSFSENALVENKMRSVYGGGISTCYVEWDLDYYHNDGSTEFSDQCISDDTDLICGGQNGDDDC